METQRGGEGETSDTGNSWFSVVVTAVFPPQPGHRDDDIFILFIRPHRRMEKPGQSQGLCLRPCSRAQGIPIPFQGFVLQLQGLSVFMALQQKSPLAELLAIHH